MVLSRVLLAMIPVKDQGAGGELGPQADGEREEGHLLGLPRASAPLDETRLPAAYTCPFLTALSPWCGFHSLCYLPHPPAA